MQHILLTLEYPPQKGGIARYLEAVVKCFPQSFEVWSSRLLTHRAWPAWLPALLRTIRLPGKTTLWVSHVHPMGSVAFITRLFRRVSYIVILHGMDFRLGTRNAWKRWLTRRILRGARLVVCNSETLAEEIRQFDNSCAVLPVRPTLPVSMEPLLSHPVSAAMSAPCRLLTVSRLVARKNHGRILEALVELPDVTYTIVGEGPERASLEKQARELGVSSRVHFLTPEDDRALLDVWRSADIFTFIPSSTTQDVEGFGIVYLEAGAAGLPIIASNEKAIGEAVSPDGAIHVPSQDTRALVDAIQELSCDPERRRKMGEANRAFVQKGFLKERLYEQLSPYVL
ncbi:glycosyltransferase family 4 protein [Candidatus Uhrbacteria bacterium]|nr:glycosyltransferase family 4 protein [Candidatus Uhrbacteria bacterium]